jgi:nitrous oxidase accessory protein NosD
LRGWVAFVPWVGRIVPVGRLYAEVIRRDGTRKRFGLVSTRVVTTAGVNAIVDAFQNTVELENFKFHGMGTGSTAENASDTALVTEVETRATGSQTEGASANIYRTVGTITATASRAVVEHGIFSASSAGTLLDRSVFSVINLANGDSIQFTYDLTLPAGS